MVHGPAGMEQRFDSDDHDMETFLCLPRHQAGRKPGKEEKMETHESDESSANEVSGFLVQRILLKASAAALGATRLSGAIPGALLRVAVFCAAAFSVHNANANLVTVTFDGLPEAQSSSDFTTGGVTFSPSCHYDLQVHVNGRPDLTTNWLGFDPGTCSGAGQNAAYLGAGKPGNSAANLYVALAGGGAFDLKSFNFISVIPDGFDFTLTSSKGGTGNFAYTGGIGTLYGFSGAEWSGLDWLIFSTGAIGGPVGFDNLALDVNSVAEPTSAASFGLALAAMAVVRLRQNRRI
jgi:hypothetical protein